MTPHQYIDRNSGSVVTEPLLGDRFVRLLYGPQGKGSVCF